MGLQYLYKIARATPGQIGELQGSRFKKKEDHMFTCRVSTENEHTWSTLVCDLGIRMREKTT